MPAESATVTDYLEKDHRRLDGLMEACRALVESGDMKAASSRCSEFNVGLRRHIRIEEDLLFPAFEEATGLGDGGPTTVMRHEHVEIQRLLGLLQELFAGEKPLASDFASLRSALMSLLHTHGEKEERILYPMTDRLLPAQRRADLMRKMQER